MKRLFSFFTAFILLLSISTFQVSAKEVGQMDNVAYHLYVSPSGDDSIADGSSDKPFATIQKAKEYVKGLDKTKGDIIVEIADGTYELNETLIFDKNDSGTENCQIRYVAADSAKPVISGGKEIKGSWRDEGNGIYSIEYNRDKKLRSLYVDGNRCYMTSEIIKGKGSYGEYNVEEDYADWAWISGSAAEGTLFKNNAIPVDTRNADDIELMTQTTWNTAIVCVDKLEQVKGKVFAKLQMPYGAIAQTPGWGNNYKFDQNNVVYNVFEWLDEPGEFYFDKTEQRLYYYPRESENLDTAYVVAPELETIVDIEGSDIQNRIHNISFEGLTFAYTDWNLYEIDGSYGRVTIQGAAGLTAYAEDNWHESIYRAYDVGPSAVYLSSADNIKFENNTICHTGNDGLSLVNDTENITVNGNIIYDLAGSALLIGHPQHMYIGDKNSDKGTHSDKEKYNADVEGSCKNIIVTNNLFKNTSEMFWGDAGIMIFAAEGLNFQYNQVENTPYSGLSLGWGWCNLNGDENSIVPNEPTTVTKNNSILNNKFVNTITTLGDGGAIYTLGDMPETVISENYILNIGTAGNDTYHIRGIHLDEGTQHVYGERNVIDINPEFACIDCGDWGNKGNNTWVHNYSTSHSYTTTDSYENDTQIIEPITAENTNWDEDAQKVINNAGIKEEYKERINSENIPETESIASISNNRPNISLIVGLAVGGVVLLSAAASAIAAIIKRKNNKRNASEKAD